MFHRKPYALTAMLTLLTPIAVSAQNTPKAYPQDGRVVQVAYQEHNVTPLRGKIFTTTQVIFAPDEAVLDVEGGDSDGWMVTHHAQLANMIFIKPTLLGSDSNLTVVTTKHSYYFHVTSNKTLNDFQKKRTYAIQFTYPVEAARKAKEEAEARALLQKEVINPNLHPERFNKEYRFSGSPLLVPLHVFDDGTFTYFELAKNQAVPAIFAVEDRQGRGSVVNVRRSGNYLIVQRIAPQFTLRHGKQWTSVFNSLEIARIKQGRRPS